MSDYRRALMWSGGAAEYNVNFTPFNDSLIPAGDGNKPAHFTFNQTLPLKIKKKTQTITLTFSPAIVEDADSSNGWTHRFTTTNANATIQGNVAGSTQLTISNATGYVGLGEYYNYKKDSSGGGNDPTPCLAKGTKVLLANGTTKSIEDIGYDDLLLTYDPYTRRFVSQYPVLATAGRRVSEMFRLNFANGESITIGSHHTIYNMETDTFQTFEYYSYDKELDLANFKGAFYAGGSFHPIPLVSHERLDEVLEVYSVHLPMQGAIITNGLWTGGNFMIIEPVERVLKGSNGINWDGNIVRNVTSRLDELHLVDEWIRVDELVRSHGATVPIQVYTSSLMQYLETARKQGMSGITDVIGTAEHSAAVDALIFSTCFSNPKPYPSQVRVVLDGNVVANLRMGEKFTFPNTYPTYVDLTNYKTYRAGESKAIFVNSVIVGFN